MNGSKTKGVLPILDISLYHSDRVAFVEKVRSACHAIGFFLLKHDIPESIVNRQLHVTRSFFNLSLEEKMKISYQDSSSFRGYMQLGVENTQGKIDYREQIEYAVEYSTEFKSTTTRSTTDSTASALSTTATGSDDSRRPHPPPYERLKGTNPWPSPELRDSTLDFADHACRIAHTLRISLCLALGLDGTALNPLFEKTNNSSQEEPPHWALKLVSYPPSGEPPNETSRENKMGVGAHTDTNFLTLVLQDTVGGLQAFSQGEWVDILASPDYLVCNLGEQAEVWSRGYFLATPHRVFAHSQVRRTSIPFFYNPVLSATIQPVNHGARWERPDDYNDKHWRNKNNSMLHAVGDNTFKSLARSHPQVLATHHPDLVVLPDGQVVRRKVD